MKANTCTDLWAECKYTRVIYLQVYFVKQEGAGLGVERQHQDYF